MPDLVIYIYMRMIPLSLPLKWLLSVSKLLRGYPLWFDNSFDFVLESMMSGMDLAPVQRLLYHILHPPKIFEMPPKNTTMFVWSFSHPMWLGILWSRPAPAWKSFCPNLQPRNDQLRSIQSRQQWPSILTPHHTASYHLCPPAMVQD